MEYKDYKIKYITEQEFLSYIDWLTRFKNPFENLFRVVEKIVTKNTISPKFNTKKYSELPLCESFYLAKYIWALSAEKLTGSKVSQEENLKDFIIYEETQTYNTDFLLEELRKETDISAKNYEKIRAELFLPLDEIVNCFKNKNYSQPFLNRLIEKKDSKLLPQKLFNAQSDYASIKLLFLVEGITEEKILPVFAKKEGFDFEKCGIKLKSAGGKTHLLKYYAQIRNLLKIPVFILLDADGTDILGDLNKILDKKDSVYLISKGEIEDILPHELIIRAINNYFSMQGAISEEDLSKNAPMTKILYELYKEKGFGEFHKSKFAQILKENILSKEDAKGEIEKILELIRNK